MNCVLYQRQGNNVQRDVGTPAKRLLHVVSSPPMPGKGNFKEWHQKDQLQGNADT